MRQKKLFNLKEIRQFFICLPLKLERVINKAKMTSSMRIPHSQEGFLWLVVLFLNLGQLKDDAIVIVLKRNQTQFFICLCQKWSQKGILKLFMKRTSSLSNKFFNTNHISSKALFFISKLHICCISTEDNFTWTGCGLLREKSHESQICLSCLVSL